MLRNLLLEEGGRVSVCNAALRTATFARFQPQSVDFLDISNPQAVWTSPLLWVMRKTFAHSKLKTKSKQASQKRAITLSFQMLSRDFKPSVELDIVLMERGKRLQVLGVPLQMPLCPNVSAVFPTTHINLVVLPSFETRRRAHSRHKNRLLSNRLRA
ncbi:ubiquitin fusion degradation protein 1 homolog [Clonorchis sinensis]|uniref:Ubiquitin fusion degradation protein 1 homolog n=1 Tax=Clonorchis sinensis TaxID=79923 RepID=G7Y7I8_CLOSI|nr:ubiquitin fusion degradation protein 1 homolog [Clonorchis sinensis]